MEEERGRGKGYRTRYGEDSREAWCARRINSNMHLLGVVAEGKALESSRNLECKRLLGLNGGDSMTKEGNFENAQQWRDET